MHTQIIYVTLTWSDKSQCMSICLFVLIVLTCISTYRLLYSIHTKFTQHSRGKERHRGREGGRGVENRGCCLALVAAAAQSYTYLHIFFVQFNEWYTEWLLSGNRCVLVCVCLDLTPSAVANIFGGFITEDQHHHYTTTHCHGIIIFGQISFLFWGKFFLFLFSLFNQ